MIGMHYSSNNLQQTKKTVSGVAHFSSSLSSSTSPTEAKGSKRSSPSPSPSTSTSTLSSSLGGGHGGGRGGGELPPFSPPPPFPAEFGHGGSEKFNLGIEDWEGLLSESAAQDPSLRWDIEDNSYGFKQLLQGGNLNNLENNVGFEAIDHRTSGFEGNTVFNSSGSVFSLYNTINGNLQNLQNPNLPALSFPPGLVFHEQQQIYFANSEQKAESFNPFTQLQHHVHSAPGVSFLNPSQQERPPNKRHNPGIPGSQMLDPGHELLSRKHEFPQMGHELLAQQLHFLLPPHQFQFQQKPLMVVPKQETFGGGKNHQEEEQQFVYGQLFKATELILTGNFSESQGILARLNHQLTPNSKPFQRSAYYFKEALQYSLLTPPPQRIPTPLDGMFKMSAYKSLSDASPLIQFMNFTSNQALLETLNEAQHIHILDFDIGFGAQWSSFMQELPRRNVGPPSSLKITAFSSPSNHHSIEITLMHENLSQFANNLGINFELEVVNFDTFDPKSYQASFGNEAIAINFPIWSVSNHLHLLPSLLCFFKQLSPKIIVSMDRGCERVELPFTHHLMYALQYYEALMDSLDSANMNSNSPDMVNKIEKFLFQPKIESIVTGRLRFPDLMPIWKNLFVSAGFSPVMFSKFAETQAECVVKRSRVQGFHVEKRQALLVLCWQRNELLSASAWRC